MSFAVPETTAKESRIKFSLWGFTVHPPLDGSFANDLAMFTKAPPGVRILNSYFHFSKRCAPGIRVCHTI